MNQCLWIWLLVIVMLSLQREKLKRAWKWLAKGKKSNRNLKPWLMRPKNPLDCPACRRAQLTERPTIPIPASIPWNLRKGKGRGTKGISTQDYFC